MGLGDLLAESGRALFELGDQAFGLLRLAHGFTGQEQVLLPGHPGVRGHDRGRGLGQLVVAVALNESALYLGSGVGSTLGGIAPAVGVGMPWLPVAAGAVALLGLALQLTGVRVSMRRGQAGKHPGLTWARLVDVRERVGEDHHKVRR